jgi:hypothetical protein
MTSFSSDFTASSSFVGTGASLDAAFVQHWPPEAGCIGFSLSGGALGAGASGVSTIAAVVTDLARQFMARSLTDGTSFQVVDFAVGTSGYDPANPLSAVVVDPGATALISEVFRDVIDQVETATLDGTSKSFVGRISRTELQAGIGEIGLFAEIKDSPFPAEIGTKFLFALAHQPLNVKTDRHVASYRIIVAL